MCCGKDCCRACGRRYDEAAGEPMERLPPGTRWRDLRNSWICPPCGTPKADVDRVEVPG